MLLQSANVLYSNESAWMEGQIWSLMNDCGPVASLMLFFPQKMRIWDYHYGPMMGICQHLEMENDYQFTLKTRCVCERLAYDPKVMYNVKVWVTRSLTLIVYGKKGFVSEVCIPNMKSLSLIVQEIWPSKCNKTKVKFKTTRSLTVNHYCLLKGLC